MKSRLIIIIALFTVSISCQTVTQSLKRCAAIDEPAARYACYDKLAGRSPADTTEANSTAPEVAAPAASKADVVVPAAPAAAPAVPAAKPKPNAEAAFGLKPKPEKERPDKLKLKWTRKEKDAYGKWIIFMDNGQVWRQTDTRRFLFEDPEHRVIISRGFGGGFILGEPGSHLRIRVERAR